MKQTGFDIAESLKTAIAYHQAGRLGEAAGVYSQILSKEPKHADALHLLGVIRRQQGQHNQAVRLIEKAIASRPDVFSYHNSIGLAYQHQGKLAQAITCYRRAIAINPTSAEAYCNQGAALQAQGQSQAAISCYEKALAHDADYANAAFNLGVVKHEMGDLTGAIHWYEKTIAIQVGYIKAHNNLGAAYQSQGRVAEAAACYETALNIDANDADTWNNLGILFQRQGAHDDAILCFRKSIACKPADPRSYYNLGNALKKTGHLSDAISAFQSALKLHPEYPDALNNLGSSFQDQGNIAQAIVCYEQAIRINPDYVNAYRNLGAALEEIGAFDRAIGCFEHVLAATPADGDSCARLVHLLQHVCDWQRLDAAKDQLERLTREALASGNRPPETPFMSLTSRDDPHRNLAVCTAWSRQIAAEISGHGRSFSFQDRINTREKIRVGYLSNSFMNHPGGHLIAGIFDCHNRDAFEVYGYSYGKDDGSRYRHRIARGCDRFTDLLELSVVQAAECIFQDRVDILVDLRGHTRNNRMGICAMRPAPVQVSFLGFPCTTGADFIDYMITDRIVTPPAHAPFYTEKLVYMPHCYQVNDHAQPISPKKWTRGEMGLPETGVVFASFNTAYKFEPVMFDCWLRILRQVPESCLWLLRVNELAEANLKNAAKAGGVSAARIVFADNWPKPAHLARLRLADLVLDTRVCNGHTSTSDALWAGVPVLTLQGRHFASRVSASILTAVGIDACIAQDIHSYEALAVGMATDADLLSRTRDKLARNKRTHPLFDTQRFALNLESAYAKMWEYFQAGQSPRSFSVVEPDSSANGSRRGT